MKIIIHIGPHKTGTTAVQKCLFEGRECLSREAICYPDLGVIQYGHHGLAELLRTRAYREAKSVFADMARLAASQNAEAIILSSEDFSALRFDDIVELQRIVGENEVEIAYSQRHPLRQVYSWWQEEVKHGSREQFPQYIVEGLLRSRSGQLLRPHMILGKWARAFGRETIKCFKYREGADIVPEMLAVLLNVGKGIELGSSIDINRSFEPVEVELIRLFNRHGLAGASELLAPDFENLRRKVVRRSKRYLQRLDLRLTEQLRHSIEQINGGWADRFFNLRREEKPIDDEVVRTWTLDPSFWLSNHQLAQELSTYLVFRSGKQLAVG